MRKLCIFILNLHRGYYLLLGAVLSLLILSITKDVRELFPNSDISQLIMPFALFGIFFMPVIAKSLFYTNEEVSDKEQSGDIFTFKGLVHRDNYFPIKINTQLSLFKRLCGYIYAILAPAPFIISAYVGSVILIRFVFLPLFSN